MFGDSLMRGHFMIRPYEVAEYLNRRFKLGLEVPAQLYRYIDPVDIEKYPLSK
jgi:hypothetical protein